MRFNYSENEHKLLQANNVAVMPIYYAFLDSATQDIKSFYTPTTAFENRIGQPLKFCFCTPKAYFLAPYESMRSTLLNTFSFVHSALVPISTVALIGTTALLELFIGMTSLIKSFVFLCKKDYDSAKKYALDGVSRLLLFPVLIIVGVLSIPVELIRFLMRLVSTVVHAIQSAFKPDPEKIDIVDGVTLEENAGQDLDNKTGIIGTPS